MDKPNNRSDFVKRRKGQSKSKRWGCLNDLEECGLETTGAETVCRVPTKGRFEIGNTWFIESSIMLVVAWCKRIQNIELA